MRMARSPRPSARRPSGRSTWPGARSTVCARPSRSLADQASPALARRARVLFRLLTQKGRQPVTSSVRTMRAMRASGPNPASLTCETIPVPEPGPGELLIEVQATAVTADQLTWPESWPAIPCHDLSGGAGGHRPWSAGLAPGGEVYGLVGFDRPGAGAEYVTAPAAALAPKPSSIHYLAAAAVPLRALPPWQALHAHALLPPR